MLCLTAAILPTTVIRDSPSETVSKPPKKFFLSKVASVMVFPHCNRRVTESTRQLLGLWKLLVMDQWPGGHIHYFLNFQLIIWKSLSDCWRQITVLGSLTLLLLSRQLFILSVLFCQEWWHHHHWLLESSTWFPLSVLYFPPKSFLFCNVA